MEATRCGPTLKPDAGVARQRVARQEVSHAIKRLKHIQSAPLEDLNADGVALPAGDLDSCGRCLMAVEKFSRALSRLPTQGPTHSKLFSTAGAGA